MYSSDSLQINGIVITNFYKKSLEVFAVQLNYFKQSERISPRF